MIDIERQLTQYGAFHDDQFGPITVDDILEEPVGQGPVRALQPRRATRPLHGWAYAAAAAAAALLLVGGAAVLFRVIGSDTPVATTPVDPSSSLTWSRVSFDEVALGDDFEHAMNSVTVGGPGFVAVGGAEPAFDGHSRAAVWTSVDSTAWYRVPHNEAIFGGATMNSVTAGGPGLVAVGSATLGEDDGVAAVVWTSPDGIAWSRVPHNQAIFGGPWVEMSSVTVGGPGLVAVGWDGGGQSVRSNAVVWTSPDGITWSRVPHNEAIFGGGLVGMNSVTVGGPGLVAVGLDAPGHGEDERPAVWTSPDGINWSRVPHNEAIFGGAWMSSVTAGGPGLVAVGSATLGEDDSVAAVWTSVDGVTWSRVPHNEAVFGGEEAAPVFSGAGMSSVTVGGPGLVAVGTDAMRSVTLPNGTWVMVAAVWTSPDGIDWSRVPHDEAVFAAPPGPNLSMTSITAGGPGLVAVGTNEANEAHDLVSPTSWHSGEDHVVVWVAVPGE